MYDYCASCEEKNTELEHLQCQLDSIRELVEAGKVKGIFPKIMEILER